MIKPWFLLPDNMCGSCSITFPIRTPRTSETLHLVNAIFTIHQMQDTLHCPTGLTLFPALFSQLGMAIGSILTSI